MYHVLDLVPCTNTIHVQVNIATNKEFVMRRWFIIWLEKLEECKFQKSWKTIEVVHGNVCLASVVTQTLDWKLHAFDVLSEFDGNNEASMGSMLQYEWLVASEYKSMEFLKSDWATIRKSPPWAIDSWGLAIRIHSLECPCINETFDPSMLLCMYFHGIAI
ncbi:hypothetical protein CsSME_00028862 [Camellia sinensis var. sinensis]